MIKKIAITTGDPDGIGFEVAAKALLKIRPSSVLQFILFRPPGADPKLIKRLARHWPLSVATSLEAALCINTPGLIEVVSKKNPALWVEACAKACKAGSLSAMATGPLSKSLIAKSGFRDLGHTDILKRISKARFTNMVFLGQHFNVALATGHIPIKEIPSKVSTGLLKKTLFNLNHLRKQLQPSLRKRPIGVLGLNPHSGEGGLIGIEEQRIFSTLLPWASKQGIPVVGPLVPDAAFQKSQWQKYSFYLALYHDQGLIPFKLAHGQESGIHLTLGIPFIRTSVDHGTAKDIFNKNKAHAGSMRDAIAWAIKFSRPIQ